MIEGLWAVQYVGIQGNGGGVVVFIEENLCEQITSLYSRNQGERYRGPL